MGDYHSESETGAEVTGMDADVLIVGAGPTGLMLAAELALAGVSVALVERRSSQHLEGSRAGGLHARSLEVLDQRGIAERFVSQGQVYPVVHFNMIPLDISDFPSRHNHLLGLWQNRIEEILADWVGELGVEIGHGVEVAGFTQTDTHVEATLSDGRLLRGKFLVGCDGGRSMVRKAAGIGFPGWEATTSWLIAEVQTAEEPKWGFHQDALGTHAIGRAEDAFARIVLTETQVSSGDPSLADLSAALTAIYGCDFGVHSPRWLSRFTDMTRQADRYRAGRVLLAGDAAHVHPSMGGQGLNIGLQDAVNLGWKLAQAAKGVAPVSLLDSYQAERQPVGARVLRNTMAQVALRRMDDRSKALAETMADLLALDAARQQIGAELSGLGVHYDLGPGHPLLGRRMPDLDLHTATGALRVFSLLHSARPVLLNLSAADLPESAPWADRVQRVEASYAGDWQLPAIGPVDPPAAVLVRPDGHVCWVGGGTAAGLEEALTRWFGPPVNSLLTGGSLTHCKHTSR